MRQINALLTQLDAKKRDHFEFVAKELQELQDCGKLNEVFIIFLFDFHLNSIFQSRSLHRVSSLASFFNKFLLASLGTTAVAAEHASSRRLLRHSP